MTPTADLRRMPLGTGGIEVMGEGSRESTLRSHSVQPSADRRNPPPYPSRQRFPVPWAAPKSRNVKHPCRDMVATQNEGADSPCRGGNCSAAY